jgi:flagellar M-ring protein FliF
LAGFLDQLRNYYTALQPGQRRIFEAVIVITVGVMVAVGMWSSGDGYQDLYTAADPGEVQQVASALEAQGIPYEVSSDGRTVRVRPDDEGRARLAGASAGKILGFEILDAIELGTSPQRERWAYQRGLEGELAQTIASLDEVQTARVHLVLPQRSEFLREDQSPTASVNVTLLPGAVLNRVQRRGIRALVSGAVDGLKAADVVVIDQEGNLLAGGDGEDDSAAGISSLTAARVAEEERVRRTVAEALGKVLGSTKELTIGVSAELDTTSVDSVERDIDPDAQALVSESIREETNQSTKPSGIPGTASNLPEEAGAGGNATQNSDLTEQRSNFDYPRSETRTVSGPGRLKRLSVGVTVNVDTIRKLATTLATGADGAAPDEAAVASKETELRTKIEETVRVAMGYDAERRDALSVAFLPFTPSEDALAEAAERDSASFLTDNLLSWLLITLCVVLTFLFVIRPFASSVVVAAQPPLPPAIEPGVQAALEGGSLTGGIGGDQDGEKRDAARNLTERLRSMVDNFENVDAADLNRLVDLEREATAQVLRRWIRES